MMNKKNLDLKNDKRAVSPVIGVILMVAITVILAAVIAAFVFGMGPSETAPTMNFKLTNSDNGTYNIYMTGGDPVAEGDLDFKEDGTTCGTQPAPGDTIWDVGDNDDVTPNAGVSGLYDISVIYIPTGQTVFEGRVRVTTAGA